MIWRQHPLRGDTGLLSSPSSCLGARAGQAGCGCLRLLARDQGDTPRFMWSYQDLQIIKVRFVANGLDVLPNARINSSNMRAAFGKENKRSRKSSWASWVQSMTHKDTGKDEVGRFLWLNQLVTLTSWKHGIAFCVCVCAPFLFLRVLCPWSGGNTTPGWEYWKHTMGFIHTENPKPLQH